jgi:hypothetical protein
VTASRPARAAATGRLRWRWLVVAYLLVLAALGGVARLLVAPSATGFWVGRLGAASVTFRDGVPELARAPGGSSLPATAIRLIGVDVIDICAGILQNDARVERRIGASRALALFGAASAQAIPALVGEVERVTGSTDDAWQQVSRDAAIEAMLQMGIGVRVAERRLTGRVRRAILSARDPLVTDSSATAPPQVEEVRRVWAAYALARVAPHEEEALGALTRSLTYTDEPFRHTYEKLHGAPPPDPAPESFEAKGGRHVNREGPVRGAALAAVARLVDGGHLRAARESALAPLVSALADVVRQAPDEERLRERRRIGLKVLRALGSRARAAAPALRALAQNSRDLLSDEIRSALDAITQ